MDDLQRVEVTMVVWIRAGADPEQVINEADYSFRHPDIADTDITDINRGV